MKDTEATEGTEANEEGRAKESDATSLRTRQESTTGATDEEPAGGETAVKAVETSHDAARPPDDSGSHTRRDSAVLQQVSTRKVPIGWNFSGSREEGKEKKPT